MPSPKKSALGRGLGALLSDNSEPSASQGSSVLRINEISPNRAQPRKDFNNEELEALSASISRYGLIQPITVRPCGDYYQIISGERRWRAARMAGLAEIPVIIINADEQKSSELALVENLQRTDLNPIEEASAFEALADDYSLTQDEIAIRLGKSRSYIANSVRLLGLPPYVLGLLSSGAISTGHAKVILSLKDAEKAELAAKTVVSAGLSVRDTEKLVKKLMSDKKPEPELAPAVDYTRELEASVRKQLGRNVRIIQNGAKSTINISYSDNNDLENLLRLLCGDDFVNSL